MRLRLPHESGKNCSGLPQEDRNVTHSRALPCFPHCVNDGPDEEHDFTLDEQNWTLAHLITGGQLQGIDQGNPDNRCDDGASQLHLHNNNN